MTKDEVIAWVKLKVDLFTMKHGRPLYIEVNLALYEALDLRSYWLDIPLHPDIDGAGKYEMYLFGPRGDASIEVLTEIPAKA